jgi:hypothetical protein
MVCYLIFMILYLVLIVLFQLQAGCLSWTPFNLTFIMDFLYLISFYLEIIKSSNYFSKVIAFLNSQSIYDWFHQLQDHTLHHNIHLHLLWLRWSSIHFMIMYSKMYFRILYFSISQLLVEIHNSQLQVLFCSMILP